MARKTWFDGQPSSEVWREWTGKETYVDDFTGVGATLIDKRCTEVEGERIGRVDDEKEYGETSTVPHRCLVVDRERLGDGYVVQLAQRLLSTKRLSGADSRNNFLSK